MEKNTVSIDDLVEIGRLDTLAEALSELAGFDVFFATPDGRVLTRTVDTSTACARFAAQEMTAPPCVGCARRGMDFRSGDARTQAAALATHRCPLGLMDAALPLSTSGGTIAMLCTTRVARDSAAIDKARRRLLRSGVDPTDAERFIGGITLATEAGLESVGRSLESVATVVMALAEQSGLAQRRAAELDRLARTDPLTGLGNRRAAFEELDEVASLAARHGRPFGLLAFDIDHFKRVNDRLGHDAGDRVLAAFAALLDRESRPSDGVFRMGGEEFLLIAHEADADGMVHLAERLRAAVAAHDFAVSPLPPVTVSLGGVHWPGGTPPAHSELLKQADELLYRAKETGRNRACL